MSKQNHLEDKGETESLADLPLTNQQTDETKGGARGDVNGDTFVDIIVGAGTSSTHVK